MRTAVVLIDCPQCGRPVTVNKPTETWEHGIHYEHRKQCQCGEILTIVLRVTREEA